MHGSRGTSTTATDAAGTARTAARRTQQPRYVSLAGPVERLPGRQDNVRPSLHHFVQLVQGPKPFFGHISVRLGEFKGLKRYHDGPEAAALGP